MEIDDKTAFMELSALLTGLYEQLSENTEYRELNKPVAEEYARELRGAFPTELQKLLNAYKELAKVDPKPAIDDELLDKLRATQAFKENVVVAKQIVNIWYFSQFKEKDDKNAPLIDGGFYEYGKVWPLVKAHPIGFSTRLHGYWTSEPPAETNPGQSVNWAVR